MVKAKKTDRLERLGIFALASLGAYGVLAVTFGLYCFIGGHNTTEAIYGAAATHVLALTAGFEAAWLHDA